MFESLGSLVSSASYMHWGSMLAGTLLISSPIIIHLINRMRYKRIRWAAMEFLLKAQKRMRRKMIIEQIVLLLLRILLVFLVGLLIARFLGFDLSGQEARRTWHVVLIDDSPSMADTYKADDGNMMDLFQTGKKLVSDQIVPAAAQANTPQFLDVMMLSEQADVNDKPAEALPASDRTPAKKDDKTPEKKAAPEKKTSTEKTATATGDEDAKERTVITGERLSNTSADSIRERLDRQPVSTIRVPLHVGINRALQRMERAARGADTARVLHLVSDCRANDWNENGEAIKDALERVREAGIKVHLVDVAHPYRKVDKKNPIQHDNLAIVDLVPNKPVVAQYEPVEFSLKVQNFGTSEMSPKRFVVKVNGDENKGKSVNTPAIAPGQTHLEKFTLTTLDRVARPDRPFDRFSLITAALAEEENGGLQADNVRHAVVEVRDRLPILVIDGNPELREKREGNSLFLERYFRGTGGGYQWVTASGVQDLEKPNFGRPPEQGRYAFVFILNVPAISEGQARGLENYVRDGGGCCFFAGPGVRPAEYNKLLYRDGTGLFPVPLPEAPSKELTREELDEKKFNISVKKILLRDPAVKQHPALVGLYTDERGQMVKDVNEIERFYHFVTVGRHWPVKRPGKWTSDPTVRELYCMPNDDSMSVYEAQAIEVAKQVVVPEKNPNKVDDPLPAALTTLKTSIPAVARAKLPLSDLAALLDRLLADQQSSGDPEEVALREYWGRTENADLRTLIARLRDQVKYGDPLYLAKEFGKGRVSVFLTSSGEAWNDWAAEKPGSASFPPVMKEMATYLSSGGVDRGIPCGSPILFQFDNVYSPTYRRAFMTHLHDPKAARGPVGGIDPAPISEPIAEQMEATVVPPQDADKTTQAAAPGSPAPAPVTRLNINVADTARPGVHLFELKQVVKINPNDPPTESIVYRASVVNLDAEREGNLARVTTDDVAQQAVKVPFHSPEDTDWIDDLKNKKTDISELGYIFALLFLLLVFEQAMSVRLSYHTSGDSLAEAAPSAAFAMQARVAARTTETES